MEPRPIQAGARVSGAAKSVMVSGLGVLLGWTIFWAASSWPALGAKLRGDAPDCPWANTLNAGRDADDLVRRWRRIEAAISVQREDPALGAKLLRSPEGAFWIPAGNAGGWKGERLLAHLLAEHAWVGESNAGDAVRPGDVVIDCGAHVGVFTHVALRRGASLVVAVEPDPANMECFRRNFSAEISSGRIVPVGKGVWSSPARLLLRESTANSGGNSVLSGPSGPAISIDVTTIDRIVADLRLSRIDYIKMDIEGAEREALQGAQETLRKYRPRLMLDAYHLPDDMTVLPRLIRLAHREYVATCGPCELEGGHLVPHAIFFRP